MDKWTDEDTDLVHLHIVFIHFIEGTMGTSSLAVLDQAFLY